MMNRRDFILDTSVFIAATVVNKKFSSIGNPIFGHNEKRYTWQSEWLANIDTKPFVKDCHEMVFTADKSIVLLTNDIRNNVLFFDKKGLVKKSWGNEFPGAHGLTLVGEKGEEYLFITDTDRHQFFKTTLDGRIIQTWDVPLDSEKYKTKEAFVPTETAITKQGEIYVADGYGAQYITHYDGSGKIKNIFGGRGDGDQYLDNAHGICIDYRNEIPTLIITDRTRCCFKIYSMEGQYLYKIEIPGANVCRPVIKGDYLYASVLTTDKTEKSGFVIILDKNNKLVSTIGGSSPLYTNNKLQPSYQTSKLFVHPHDVLVDDEDNLYVCQWNSDQVLPYKFMPHV